MSLTVAAFRTQEQCGDVRLLFAQAKGASVARLLPVADVVGAALMLARRIAPAVAACSCSARMCRWQRFADCSVCNFAQLGERGTPFA